MVRLYTGIIVLCLLSTFACTAYSQERIIGTVRLKDNRQIFNVPATLASTKTEFVTVTCAPDGTATPTTDRISGFGVYIGQTLTILDILTCAYKNPVESEWLAGRFVHVRSQQGVIGYTQLPNYHDLVQTVDAEGFYKVLYLNLSQCAGDVDCHIKEYAQPFHRFAQTYPTSPHVPEAAEKAAIQYKYAADTFQYIIDHGGHPTLSNYATRYTRNELIVKANEYRMLESQMKALANQKPIQKPAPQQTASTQPTARPAEPSKPVPQTVAPPQPAPQQTVAAQPASSHAASQQPAPPQQTTPAPPTSQSNILTTIFYALLILLTLAYIVGYLILYKHITNRIPIREIGYSLLEGVFFGSIAAVILFFLPNYLTPFMLIGFAICLYLRLHALLDPVRKKLAADELKAKQDTLAALAPLLDHLHGMYGRYAEILELIPAAWYAPRKHYIEYMAHVLYTVHERENPHRLTQRNLTSDSHPLWILRFLSFPTSHLATEQQLSDSNHPYIRLIRAITDPDDRDRIVFQKLIPLNVDLLTYLKEQRWLPAMTDEAEHLAEQVEEEIENQKYVIIGRRTNPEPRPFPVFYGDTRFRHSYLIGKTGSGKSTLLRNLIAQDIHHGHGLIVLSPENDLVEKLLTFIPEERKDDLIYFDPTDIKPPIIGFNPLALEDGEDLNQKAGETMTVLTRALGDLGVTMEPLIQNAIYALLQCRNATFADLRSLIDPYDSKLRSRIKNDRSIDETTRHFWTRYEQSSYYQKSHDAVLNRLNPFFRPPISTILATPSLSFKTELNQDRRIIFLNLSRLRGMEAATIGQLLLGQIQQALLVRDELPEDQRIPYYLYIDEFQTYAAQSEQSLVNLFNGARKYKLAVTIAHQTTADIPAKLLSSIVGNVGTVIALQLAAEDAPFFARQLQIKRPNSEAAAPEALQNLSTGFGYVTTPLEPFGVQIAVPSTPVVPLPHPLPFDELKSTSKKNFGLMPEVDDPAPIPEVRFFPPPEPEIELQIEPENQPEEAPATAIAAVADDQVAEILTADDAPQAKPKARVRAARKPVVRKKINKRSLIPDETIEIE